MNRTANESNTVTVWGELFSFFSAFLFVTHCSLLARINSRFRPEFARIDVPMTLKASETIDSDTCDD